MAPPIEASSESDSDPSHHGQHEQRDGRGFKVEENAKQGRDDGQRQSDGQPVGQRLGEAHQFQRQVASPTNASSVPSS